MFYKKEKSSWLKESKWRREEKETETILNTITDAIKVKQLIRFSKMFYIKWVRYIWKDPKLIWREKKLRTFWEPTQ